MSVELTEHNLSNILAHLRADADSRKARAPVRDEENRSLFVWSAPVDVLNVVRPAVQSVVSKFPLLALRQRATAILRGVPEGSGVFVTLTSGAVAEPPPAPAKRGLWERLVDLVAPEESRPRKRKAPAPPANPADIANLRPAQAQAIADLLDSLSGLVQSPDDWVGDWTASAGASADCVTIRYRYRGEFGCDRLIELLADSTRQNRCRFARAVIGHEYVELDVDVSDVPHRPK